MSVVDALPSERNRSSMFFEQLPSSAGAVSLVVGLVVLGTWAFGLQDLPGIPGSFPMSPMTAAAFVLAGASAVLSRAAALVLVVVALLTWAEGLLKRNLGIDLIFFPSAVSASGGNQPGRMAINTAAAATRTGGRRRHVLLPRDGAGPVCAADFESDESDVHAPAAEPAIDRIRRVLDPHR